MEEDAKPKARESAVNGVETSPLIQRGSGASAKHEDPVKVGSVAGKTDGGCMVKVIVKHVGAAGTETPCLELLVHRQASVLDLKKRIQEELRPTDDFVPVDRQRLIFAGRMLTNNDHVLVKDVKMLVDVPNFVHLAPIPVGMEASSRRRNENTSDETEGRPQLTRGRAFRGLSSSSREARREHESPYGGYSRHADDEETERRRLHRLRRESTRAERREQRRREREAEAEAEVEASLPATAGLVAALPVHPLFCPHVVMTAQRIPLGLAEALAMSAVPVTAVVDPRALDVGGATLVNQGMHDDVERDIWRGTNEMLPLCRVLPEQLVRSLTSAGSDADRLRELRYQAELEETTTLLDQVAQRGVALAGSLRRFLFARRAGAQSNTTQTNSLNPGQQFDPFARF